VFRAAPFAMIITDDFIYAHHPKTGGTFVSEMLLQVATRVPGFRCESVPGSKHGGVRRIPPEHRDKLLVVNVRNVFDHYASRYAFRWWADPEHARKRFDVDEVMRDFPTFPQVSFSEFLRLYNTWTYRNDTRHGRRNRSLERCEIGHNSYTLLKMTQTDVMKLIRQLDGMSDARLRARFAKVRFLRTESLNDDLAALLEEVGVPAAELEVIRRTERILPKRGGRGRAVDWRDVFSDEDVRFVLRRDRLYFRLFPEMSAAAAVEPAPEAR
jgi:hypothetical protein